MGRKPISDVGSVAINVRIPADVAGQLDEEAAQEMRKHPGRVVTRSDIVREVLALHVAERGKQQGRKR